MAVTYRELLGTRYFRKFRVEAGTKGLEKKIGLVGRSLNGDIPDWEYKKRTGNRLIRKSGSSARRTIFH